MQRKSTLGSRNCLGVAQLSESQPPLAWSMSHLSNAQTFCRCKQGLCGLWTHPGNPTWNQRFVDDRGPHLNLRFGHPRDESWNVSSRPPLDSIHQYTTVPTISFFLLFQENSGTRPFGLNPCLPQRPECLWNQDGASQRRYDAPHEMSVFFSVEKTHGCVDSVCHTGRM